jgi:hypothetical protein
MFKRTTLAAIVAVGVAFAVALPAAGAQPSTCVECCEGNAACEALAELADLHASVDELVPDAGIATSLDAKVDATTASVLDSRIVPALNQIDAFGNEVDGLQRAGQLSAATSNALKAKHDAVKSSINNIR